MGGSQTPLAAPHLLLSLHFLPLPLHPLPLPQFSLLSCHPLLHDSVQQAFILVSAYSPPSTVLSAEIKAK